MEKNNDEAEKQERRRRSLVEMVLSSSPRPSPDSFRNSFSSIANLNSAQLAEHFKNCMKLSNENKINARNAFQLQLIDYMAMMLKRKESEMDNFQIASCTLDASAKIYACRVDNVHNDAVKMAGSLIRSNKKDKGNDKNGDEKEDGEGRATINPTKKKRSKPHATVESNFKNLDSKEAESAFKIDPFFKRMAQKFDECQSGGCHFLANLKVLDETQEIVLSSDRKWWRDPATVGENSNEMVSLPIPKFKAIQSAEVCPSFSNFTFNNWSPDNENSACSELGPFCQDKILGRDTEYVFDMNAIPEPMDTSDVGEGMDVDHGPDESSVGTVEVVEFGRRSSGGSSVELIRNALSLSPQEYSYFKKGICWAGPLHWNFKPLTKSYQTRAKRKRKRIVVTLAYEENPSDDFFKVSGKPICLLDRTVAKWDAPKVTLPEDKHLSVSVLYKLFLKPKFAIHLRKTAAVNMEGVNPYNFDNTNDRINYCTNFEREDGLMDNDAGNILDLPTEDDHQDDELSETENGYELIQAPNMVHNVPIPYAKSAKKMDMKRLKRTIFKMLTHQNEETTTEPNAMENEPLEVRGKVSFSKVYHELPKNLPPRDAQNLSFPLAFAALLHLANDNILIIEGTPDLSDVIVSQDKKIC